MSVEPQSNVPVELLSYGTGLLQCRFRAVGEMCVVTHAAHTQRKGKMHQCPPHPPRRRQNWRVTLWSVISVIPVMAVHHFQASLSFSLAMCWMVIICHSTVKDCIPHYGFYLLYLVHFPDGLSQSNISMLCYIWSASILLNKMWWRLSKATAGIFCFVCRSNDVIVYQTSV